MTAEQGFIYCRPLTDREVIGISRTHFVNGNGLLAVAGAAVSVGNINLEGNIAGAAGMPGYGVGIGHGVDDAVGYIPGVAS